MIDRTGVIRLSVRTVVETGQILYFRIQIAFPIISDFPDSDRFRFDRFRRRIDRIERAMEG